MQPYDNCSQGDTPQKEPQVLLSGENPQCEQYSLMRAVQPDNGPLLGRGSSALDKPGC